VTVEEACTWLCGCGCCWCFFLEKKDILRDPLLLLLSLVLDFDEYEKKYGMVAAVGAGSGVYVGGVGWVQRS
jgi:hypothetical protein